MITSGLFCTVIDGVRYLARKIEYSNGKKVIRLYNPKSPNVPIDIIEEKA